MASTIICRSSTSARGILHERRRQLSNRSHVPRSLAARGVGLAALPYVHTFDSGMAGPHVMINALTHGNEVCGAIVVDALLRAGLRPRRGRLTLAFANIAAYRTLRSGNARRRPFRRPGFQSRLDRRPCSTIPRARRANSRAPAKCARSSTLSTCCSTCIRCTRRAAADRFGAAGKRHRTCACNRDAGHGDRG